MITCILQKLYNNADAHTSIRAWASRDGLNIACVASVERGRGMEGRGKGRRIGERG